MPSEDATGLQFTCADFTSDPTMIPVQFWAKDKSTGIADYLNVMVLLYDNSNMCTGTQAPQSVSIISGQISTENQEQVPDVEVKVSNDVKETVVNTGDAGLYQAGIPLVDHTMIRPEKNDDHSVGISTADLIKVQKHILGIKTIESPYKLIAADANRDGEINPVDLIQIRKVLLGKIDRFPDNTSWRFVDASYHFAKKEKALKESFPEQIELNSTTGRDAKKNFIGIKIGDLNGNVFTSQSTNRNRSAIDLVVPHVTIEVNNPVKVPVFLSEGLDIEGIQLQLLGDINQIEITGLESGQLDVDPESIMVKDGMVRLSVPMADGVFLDVTEPIFYINLLPKQSGDLMDALAISDQGFPSELYGIDRGIQSLHLQFGSESMENRPTTFLLQNRPNPFRAETTIEFWLSTSQRVGLKIYDPAGRILKEIYQDFDQGQQQIVVDKSDLTPGVLYYELQTNQGRETKRMILLE